MSWRAVFPLIAFSSTLYEALTTDYGLAWMALGIWTAVVVLELGRWRRERRRGQ